MMTELRFVVKPYMGYKPAADEAEDAIRCIGEITSRSGNTIRGRIQSRSLKRLVEDYHDMVNELEAYSHEITITKVSG